MYTLSVQLVTSSLYKSHLATYYYYYYYYYCGWQEEPAILISRLLLRMRRMYVASFDLDFH